MFADLHLHTCFSDGTFTPEELVRHAAARKLSTIALTDHDTLAGCERAKAACREAGIDFIAGSELTSEHEGREVHVLGYFLHDGDEAFNAELERFQEVRRHRIEEMVSRINGCGVPLKVESVHAVARCQSPGRPHVARALVNEGFCASYDEAFSRFLRNDRPGWVPKYRISVGHAIALIHGVGGLAVMAHPGLNRIDAAIPDLVRLGLDGLECYHSCHTPTATERYLKIAEALGLLVTGGSDCHGFSKKKPLIGSIKLPEARLVPLREAFTTRSLNHS